MFKGLTTTLVFFVITVLVELLVVFYAMSIGVKDEMLIQWNPALPGGTSTLTITVSPLFHLIPVAVIIALMASWIYLSKCACMKPREPVRVGAGVKRIEPSGMTAFFNKAKSVLFRASVKSALIIILVFAAFALIISLLAYPQLIYRSVTDAYKNNPSLLSFIRTSGSVFAPVASAFRGALPLLAPGVRDLGAALGSAIGGLAGLDGAGKYLVFQNAAAWISAFVALFYAVYARRSYRYRKGRS